MVACYAIVEEEAEDNPELLAAGVLQREQPADRGRRYLHSDDKH